MKKILNVLLIIFTILFIIGSVFIIYCLCVTVKEKLNVKALNTVNSGVKIYDDADEVVVVATNDSQNKCCSDEIPDYVKKAFVSIEDKRFYRHKGLDYKRILKATAKNIVSFSYKEGASTISQQLVKNTQLSSKKTVNRKLKEMKLAILLEKKFDKDEILTMYLNTIYFGEGTYGIKNASMKYFSKLPEKLSLDEGAYLAGIVKAPSYLSNNYDKAIERRNLVLKCMFKQGYIEKSVYESVIQKRTEIRKSEAKTFNNYFVKKVYCELENLGFDPNAISEYKVYTSFNKNVCETSLKAFNDCDLNCNYEIVVINSKGRVMSNINSCNIEISRSVGSAIKPLLVYAPCIEENVISPLTKIEDVKTDFNGYTPANYNDEYNGYISCEDALKKSSNVVAVKLMNILTPKKSLEYAKKFDLTLDYEKDENLSLALGCSANGQSLEEVASCYDVFVNDGFYYKNSYIDEIKNAEGKTVYKRKETPQKVFGEDTAFLTSEMLRENAKSGTAKKLSFLNFYIGAKTGTVGNKLGNEDAVCIAYTKDYVVGVRLFAKDEKLPNNVTGGTYPTFIARNIFESIYKDTNPDDIRKPQSVTRVEIDKYVYDNFNEIVECKNSSVEKILGYFKSTNLPTKKLKDVLKPTVSSAKLSVNTKEIEISLCVASNYEFRLYKVIKNNTVCIYDSSLNGKTERVIDEDLSPDSVYSYYLIPFIVYNGEEIVGEKYDVGKVKTPKHYIPDNWWDSDL